MTTLLIRNLFDDFINEPEDFYFVNDPIAVALLRNESDGNLSMIETDKDPSSLQYILEGKYQEQADIIREYYKKKLFFGAMDNSFSTTKFRNDLQTCLERKEINHIKSNEVGMLARLPDFYLEDITRDKIRIECNGGPIKETNFWADELPARYMCGTHSRFGKNRTHSYWFNVKKDRALCFHLDGTNPLINLFNDYLEPNKVILLQGGFHTRKQDEFHFYQGKCKVLV